MKRTPDIILLILAGIVIYTCFVIQAYKNESAALEIPDETSP